MGVPASSVNCFEGADFFPGAVSGAMRVPRPAAGIMTNTFTGRSVYERKAQLVQSGWFVLEFWQDHDSCNLVLVKLRRKFFSELLRRNSRFLNKLAYRNAVSYKDLLKRIGSSDSKITRRR